MTDFLVEGLRKDKEQLAAVIDHFVLILYTSFWNVDDSWSPTLPENYSESIHS